MYLKSLYPEVPPTPDTNVHELLFNLSPAASDPDYTFLIDGPTGRKLSRDEFKERVYDGMIGLGAPISEGGLGISGESGDIVGIVSVNCMDYITLVQTCLAITTPFALISSFSTHHELVHSIRIGKVTKLFCDPSALSRALKAAKEVGLSSTSVFVLEGAVNGRKSLDSLIKAVRRKKLKRIHVRPATRNTLAYLVFSSGTTGLPKAVMISHGNLWFTMQAAIVTSMVDMANPDYQPVTPPVVVMGMLPFHHTYGFQYFCIRPIFGFVTLLVFPRWDPGLLLKAIPKYKVNALLLVPSMLHQLAQHKSFKSADFSTITSIGSGAAYLPPELTDKIVGTIKTNSVSEGYGLSECTLSATRTPTPGSMGLQPIRGSAGILLPGMEAKLLRDDGSHAEIDEPGEMWLKGRNVALGYFGNEEATKETFIDGWLRTGDKFKTDGKGSLFFVDRMKDTLKISGAQVSPTEIENVLRAHPGGLITDVSVAGVSGGRTSDEKVPRAWVVLSSEGKRRGKAAVFKELVDWSDQNLSSYKRLRGGVEAVDSIPKSPTGKVLRRTLQDKYEKELKAKSKAKL